MPIGSLLRFALPAILFYLIYKTVRAALSNGNQATGNIKGQPAVGDDPIIEICPKCGSERGRKHSC